MLFFSIFNTSNHKNILIIKMLNAKYFSIQLQWSLIFDTLLQQDVRDFYYYDYYFSLSHSLLCRASLHCFPLSFPFSFSMSLHLSLTLDLHFNNGERHDDEDGTAIAIFPRASSKVSWTCASSMVSDATTRMVSLVPHWT